MIQDKLEQLEKSVLEEIENEYNKKLKELTQIFDINVMAAINEFGKMYDIDELKNLKLNSPQEEKNYIITKYGFTISHCVWGNSYEAWFLNSNIFKKAVNIFYEEKCTLVK